MYQSWEARIKVQLQRFLWNEQGSARCTVARKLKFSVVVCVGFQVCLRLHVKRLHTWQVRLRSRGSPWLCVRSRSTCWSWSCSAQSLSSCGAGFPCHITSVLFQWLQTCTTFHEYRIKGTVGGWLGVVLTIVLHLHWCFAKRYCRVRKAGLPQFVRPFCQYQPGNCVHNFTKHIHEKLITSSCSNCGLISSATNPIISIWHGNSRRFTAIFNATRSSVKRLWQSEIFWFHKNDHLLYNESMLHAAICNDWLLRIIKKTLSPSAKLLGGVQRRWGCTSKSSGSCTARFNSATLHGFKKAPTWQDWLDSPPDVWCHTPLAQAASWATSLVCLPFLWQPAWHPTVCLRHAAAQCCAEPHMGRPSEASCTWFSRWSRFLWPLFLGGGGNSTCLVIFLKISWKLFDSIWGTCFSADLATL